MADPQALLVADAAARAVEFVGLPEAQLNLAQAVVHLATAPKSNRAALAIWQAREDVRDGVGGEVPAPPARRALPGRGDARPRQGLRVPSRRPAGLGRPAVRTSDESVAARRYYEPSHTRLRIGDRCSHGRTPRPKTPPPTPTPTRPTPHDARHPHRRRPRRHHHVHRVPRRGGGAWWWSSRRLVATLSEVHDDVAAVRTEPGPVAARPARRRGRGQRRPRARRRPPRHGRVARQHRRRGLPHRVPERGAARSSRPSRSPRAPPAPPSASGGKEARMIPKRVFVAHGRRGRRRRRLASAPSAR